MPRSARKQSECNIYHVMLRGINRQDIFEEAEDYGKMLRLLKEYQQVCGYSLYAYCLLSDHMHLLLQPGDEPLEKIFRRLGAKYVYWFNTKYDRSGPLFQDRYKSEPVNNDGYFLTVIRYIHMNPVKAGQCKQPANYAYSSFSNYFTNELIDSEPVLNQMGREAFLRFHAEQNQDVFMDLNDQRPARMTDEKALKRMKKVSGCENAAEFQKLPAETRNAALTRMLKKGVSIRQASRITGVSIGIVRKFTPNREDT